MTYLRNKKIIYLITVCLLVTVIISSGFAIGQNAEENQAPINNLLSINDGYLFDYNEEERESVRAVDYTIATSEVPANSTVESELLIANYGIDTKEDMSIEPYIIDVETGDVIDDDYYELEPQQEYSDINLEPGEHKLYKFDLKFYEDDNNYTVGFINSDAPDDKPLISKDIGIVSEDSGISDSLILDRDRLTKDKISITRFKDETVFQTSRSGSSTSLPPVEKNEEGDIVETDVAEGTISDFGNIRADSDIYGSITSDTGDINVGFSSENIPTEEHYAISLLYELENINSAEINIVSASGEEVDEETDYYINSEDSVEERVLQLSNEEISYIQSQGELYFEFNNVDEVQNDIEIKLYEMEVVALNDIWNIPEPEISADLTAEPDSVEVGDNIQITAEITNDGPVAIDEEFRLRETNAADVSTTVSVRDEEIINPGDTETISFNVPATTLDEHVFELFGDEVSVEVSEEGEGAIRPAISTDVDVVGIDEPIHFSITNVDDEDMDRIDNFEWRFDEEFDYTNEENVEKEFEEDGSKTITLRTEYEDADGNIQTHRTQTVVDVIEGPQYNITGAQYEFLVDDQESNGEPVGSSISGNMMSGTCEVSCGASFNFDSVDLAVYQGINMLVFEVDRDGVQYEPIHYGTYDVVDDKFATTDSVSANGMRAIQDSMEDGGTEGASNALINDINNLQGEDRYFVFVGGGNPSPTQNANDVFNTLENIGADLDGSGEINENSMWTFATQTLSNGDVTPLHESYLPAESEEPAISEEYTVQPFEIEEETNVSPDRPVHYDIFDLTVVGDISDSVIVWTMDDDTIIDDELHTSEIYTSDNTEYTVEVLVEDELGLEVIDEKVIETNSTNPVADIPNLTPVIDENNVLYSTDSFDADSTINTYEWTIIDNDEEEISYVEKLPEHDWTESGLYDIELTVTDNYGNTDTDEREIQVLGAPPDTDADITRVISDFNSPEHDLDNVLANQPILYYPLEFADGITKEYVNAQDGLVENDVVKTEGPSENALEFNPESYITVNTTTKSDISEQFGVSMWVKSDDTGVLYDSESDESEFIIQTSDTESDVFLSNNDEEIELDFDSNINTGEWTHVAVSYDVVNGTKLFVDGELDNSASDTIGNINKDIASIDIGSDYNGKLSDLQIYNMRLNEDDASVLYENNAEPLINEPIEGVFYEFGNEYNNIDIDSTGDGIVEPRTDYYNLVADSSISNQDSEQSIEIQDINYEYYDSVYMSYEAEFVRQMSDGDDITGRITMDAQNQQTGSTITNHMSSTDNGVIELDVSEINETDSLSISAESFGSNLGRTSVEIYEVWGSTETIDYTVTDFYDEIYPDIISNTMIHETRNGVKISQKDIESQIDTGELGDEGLQHNIMPAMDALELDVSYDIRTESTNGINLYADNSGDYTLGSGGANPESILCESSAILETNCEDIDSGDSVLENGPYSHVGLEVGALDGHTVIESLQVNSDTTRTDNPNINLDGSVSEGSEDGIYIKEYEWDLNADTSFNPDYVGEELTYEFDELGTHEVALRTTDTLGESNIETFEFEVTNLEPSISPQFTTEADVGDEVRFEVNTDAPGDADIDQVIWDLGDGTYQTGHEIRHEYLISGEYDVTVIAIDEAGLTVSDTEEIIVSSEAPDLDDITTEANAHVMDTLLFDTSGDGFDDFDTDEHPLIVQNRIDLTNAEDPNDGDLQFDWLFPQGPIMNQDDPHTVINQLGTQEFEVTATDNEGRTTSETIQVNVDNDGPNIDVDVDTPIQVTDDGEVEISNDLDNIDEDEIEVDTDSDGKTFVSAPIEVSVNTYHFHPRIGGELTVNMNDGHVETHELPEDAGSDYTYEFEHEFDVSSDEYQEEDFPVNFDIEAEIVDDFGATAQDSKNVDVGLREISTDLSVSPRQAVIFQEDLDFEPVNIETPDSDIETYHYDFGDGDTEERQNSNVVNKEYFEEGTYQPELTITDEYGQQDEAFAQIRIMVDFDDVVFLACGIRFGSSGPSDSECEDAYEGTQLDGWVGVEDSGIQTWTVPQTGIYELEIAGANGGGNQGGEGAVIKVETQLNRGQELNIGTGLMGSSQNDFTSGGGGTFVVDDQDQPIIIAGGGGGSTQSNRDQDANLGESGLDGATSGTGNNQGSGSGGGPTQGGTACDNSCAEGTGAGAGFETQGDVNGRMNDNANPYMTNINPLEGGTDFSDGGFGGGGASIEDLFDRAGGGGGYGGGGSATGSDWAAAGGGGSYIPQDAQIIETGNYNDFNTPDEVIDEGTGYLDVDIEDSPDTEIDVTEIEMGGATNTVENNNTISVDSTLELNADYDEGLSDAPEVERKWYVSDGTTMTGDSETHEFESTGQYTITVESIDENDIPLSQDSIMVQVE